jgi:hypothetical protein
MPDQHAQALSPDPSPTPWRGDDYRRLASKIREVAVRTPLPIARRELAQFAAKYERRVDHLDRR